MHYIITHPASMSGHDPISLADREGMEWVWTQARLRDLCGKATEVTLSGLSDRAQEIADALSEVQA